MATVHVQPGICGFDSTIRATADDDLNVSLTVTSACPQIVRLGAALAQVSALQLLRKPIHETAIYQAAGAARCHAACPVPSAIVKAIEVAAGLALPHDVHMTITRE